MPEKNNTRKQIDINQLRLALVEYFNEAELQDLCFELHIDFESLPGQGKTAKARDLVQQCDRERRLSELVTAVLTARPNIPPYTLLLDTQTEQSPFKGLLAFQEDDYDIFFGREEISEELAERLTGKAPTHFLALVGASGSGKSSIVRAGMIPAIRQKTKWPIYVITPTAHPLESVAVSLAQDNESVTAVTTLIDDMKQDERSLHLYCRRLLTVVKTPGQTTEPKLLLVIDQFEELFTLCRDEVERQAFIDNLVTAVNPESSGSTIIVITLRADFYNQCLQYQPLHALLEDQQKIVPAMSSDDLRAAIENPARKNNLTFEKGLVDLLLRDVNDEPGGLPLLSHALLETWRRREGNHLTLAGYTTAGGVHGAIAHTADAVYQDQLRPSEQAIARRLFLELTDLGEGTEDTRRRANLDQLLPAENPEPVRAVLNILADARLVTVQTESVEVAHEALIRAWPALRAWLDENREWLRQRRQITEAAESWADNNQDTGYLYRGSRLAAVETWPERYEAELSTLDLEFLRASLAERTRLAQEKIIQQQRAEQLEQERKTAVRLRRLSVGLGAVFLLALAAALFALNQRQNAQESLLIAQTAEAAANQEADQRATAEAEALREADQRATTEADARQLANERATAESLANLRADELATAQSLAQAQADAEASARETAVAAQAAAETLSNELRVQQLINQALLSEDPNLTLLLALEAIHAATAWAVDIPPEATQAILDTLNNTRSLTQFTPRYENSNGGTSGLNRMVPLVVGADGRYLYGYTSILGVQRWLICANQPDGLCPTDQDNGNFGELVVSVDQSDQSQVFSANGAWLAATAENDAVARIWQLPGEAETATLSNTINLANEDDAVLSLSNDGRWLVVQSGSEFQLWDAENGQQTGQLAAPDGWQAETGAVSPDGRWLAAFFYDAANQEAELVIREIGETGILPDSGTTTSLALRERILQFSPNGQWLSAGLSVFDLEQLLTAGGAVSPIELAGHTNRIESVRFSADGRYVLTTSTGQSSGGEAFQIKALLWDLEAPDLLATNLPHRDYSGSRPSITVWDGAFSPDGRWLATVSNASGNTVTLFPIVMDEVIRLGCQAAEREFSEAEWQQYFPGEPYRQTCP